MSKSIYIALLAIICGPGLAAWAQEPQPTEFSSSEMATALAEYDIFPTEQTLDAVIEAVHQSTVSAQTGGEVMEVLFDADDVVRQGQVLVRLKATQQQAALAQAQAQVKEYSARHQEAREEHNRLKKLVGQAVSQSALDAAAADADAYRARMAAAQADVAKAEELLRYTEIRAPYSGIVLKRHIQPGENAMPGQALMTGFSLDQLRAVAQVPQDVMVSVREHMQARVIVNNTQGERSVPGASLVIMPYAEQGHTFRVRINLPPNTPDLYPGMFVKVAFITGEAQRLVVPAQAVAFRGEVRAVYVMREGRPAMRQVRLGRNLGDSIEILAGLSPGEAVVLDPVQAVAAARKEH